MASARIQRKLWRWYSRSYDGLLELVPYQRLLDTTAEALACGPDDRLVDLGCGTGNLLARVAAGAGPWAWLVGVDSAASMLAAARPKLVGTDRAELVESDLLEWLAAAPSDSFDRVVSVNVLYTLDAAQRAQFWADALRILRPDGRLVVVTTDRAGFGPVLREHLQERSVLSSLRPRLLAVLGLNLAIWALEARHVFDPAPVGELVGECRRAGGQVLRTERCYGGATDGVDVLLAVEPARVDVRPRSTATGMDGSGVDEAGVDEAGVPLASSPPTLPTPTVG
ncbi:MAG: class I SAM-dependent DNA methyltransferase [Actinomycetes bacterium]